MSLFHICVLLWFFCCAIIFLEVYFIYSACSSMSFLNEGLMFYNSVKISLLLIVSHLWNFPVLTGMMSHPPLPEGQTFHTANSVGGFPLHLSFYLTPKLLSHMGVQTLSPNIRCISGLLPSWALSASDW